MEELTEAVVLLRLVVPKVVRFVQQHDIRLEVFQPGPIEVRFPQFTQTKHPAAQPELVVVLQPHLLERLGRNDQRPPAFAGAEPFQDGGAHERLAEAHHVAEDHAIVPPEDVERASHGGPLEIGQGRKVARHLLERALQAVANQMPEDFDVKLEGRDEVERPTRLQLAHQQRVEVFGFLPQCVEPARELLVIAVAADLDVQLGVVAQPGPRQIRGTDDRHATIIPPRRVIEDVRFGVQAGFRIDADDEPSFLNQFERPVDKALVLVGLAEGFEALPNGLADELDGLGAFPLRGEFPLARELDQLRGGVRLGELFNRLVIGQVSDQQPKFRQFFQFRGNRIEA